MSPGDVSRSEDSRADGVCRDEPTARFSSMNWLVSVYADIPLAVPSEPLVRQSPMFADWESVGGVQRRITLSVQDTAAGDADSACEVARREVEDRLTLLKGISKCNATPLD